MGVVEKIVNKTLKSFLKLLKSKDEELKQLNENRISFETLSSMKITELKKTIKEIMPWYTSKSKTKDGLISDIRINQQFKIDRLFGDIQKLKNDILLIKEVKSRKLLPLFKDVTKEKEFKSIFDYGKLGYFVVGYPKSIANELYEAIKPYLNKVVYLYDESSLGYGENYFYLENIEIENTTYKDINYSTVKAKGIKLIEFYSEIDKETQFKFEETTVTIHMKRLADPINKV